MTLLLEKLAREASELAPQDLKTLVSYLDELRFKKEAELKKTLIQNLYASK